MFFNTFIDFNQLKNCPKKNILEQFGICKNVMCVRGNIL